MDRETAIPSVSSSFPGERAQRWIEYHREVAATSTHVYDFVWNTTAEADGPFCSDIDGNTLLDFAGHVASSPLGYNNPKIMDRLAEFELLDPLKIAGQDFYSSGGWPVTDPDVPGPTQLMHAIVSVTEQSDLDTVFLSNSGAEAVENALKICYDYRDGAKYGVTFDGAFHGRTLGALSLNRSKAVHRRSFPELAGITALPYCVDRSCNAATCSCGYFPTEERVSRLGQLVHPHDGPVDPTEVAYVIIEPIQGEGGYRVPSESFMRDVGAICDSYEIPLIVDEVQTGMGRTGKFWGFEHFALDPDVIVAGKALRVGATIGRNDVFPSERARLSSTWGAGDLIASLQGVLTIEAIQEYDLMANARTRGRQLQSLLQAIETECIVDVRGKGLLVGVEFDTKNRRDAVMECCVKREGLLTLPCGIKTLRLLPPLDVTEREIAIGAECFERSLSAPEVSTAHPRRPTGDDAS